MSMYQLSLMLIRKLLQNTVSVERRLGTVCSMQSSLVWYPQVASMSPIFWHSGVICPLWLLIM